MDSETFTPDDLRGKAENLSGMRFGLLTVLDCWIRKPEGKSTRIHWKCLCDCGATVFASQNFLRKGHKRSCGCLVAKVMREIATTHGKTGTPAHRSWMGMRQRCMQPGDPNYSAYGGRGIKICERWNSFENFFTDMGERPDGYSIERKDVNGDYEPLNCEWIPLSDQVLNRRTTLILHACGESKSLSDWSRQTGISTGCLSNRVARGWDQQKALETPPGTAKRKSKMYTYMGKTQHLRAWARELGVHQPALWRRLNRGWTIDKAFGTPMRPIQKR